MSPRRDLALFFAGGLIELLLVQGWIQVLEIGGLRKKWYAKRATILATPSFLEVFF